MNSSIIPPYIIFHKSKEVIFYIPKGELNNKNMTKWVRNLNLVNYKAMALNSKCIFNRLKEHQYT